MPPCLETFPTAGTPSLLVALPLWASPLWTPRHDGTISAGAEFCPSTVFEIYKESLRSLLMLLLEIQCKMEIDSESISKNFQTQWHRKTFTLKPTDSLEVGTLLWASLAWRLAIGYHITVATEGAMYVNRCQNLPGMFSMLCAPF